MTENVLVPSVEAISHQIDDRLFRELTAAFDSTHSSKQLGVLIPKIIVDITGIVTEFHIEQTDDCNAWVYPPDLDKNHPFIDDWRKTWYTGKEAYRLMKTEKVNYLTGSVDRKLSKVSGPFTKIVCPIHITRGLLSGTHAGLGGNVGTVDEEGNAPRTAYGTRFTSAECAAIIMHEIGHVFSYFESLADSLTTNWVLEASAQEFFKTSDQTIKIKIINDVEDALHINFNDATAVAEGIVDREAYQTVVLSELAKTARSKMGANIYDLRSWESASDQFASRHGASLALATGLDKMYRLYGMDDRYGKIVHWVGQITQVFGVIAAISLSLLAIATGTILMVYGIMALLIIAMCLFTNPFDDIYDPHKFRLGRIQQDIVSRLKRHQLPKEYIAKTIKEFDQIAKIVSDVQHHETLWRKVWVFCSSATRKQRDKINEQQELELLANNELFISSARFRVLV